MDRPQSKGPCKVIFSPRTTGVDVGKLLANVLITAETLKHKDVVRVHSTGTCVHPSSSETDSPINNNLQLNFTTTHPSII